MLIAVALAALAGWWAVGSRARPVPARPPAATDRRAGVISRGTRALLGGGLAVVVAQVVSPWWVGLVAGTAVGAAAYALLGLVGPDHRAAEAERRAGTPEALTLLASAVEAGQPLATAVRTVAPSMPGVVGADLLRVAAGSEMGLGQREAWAVLQDSPAWRRAAADIGRVATSGAAVAPVLRRHAGALAEAARDERLRVARTTGVRSVFPLSVCFLPAFVLVGIVPTVGAIVTRFLG